MNLTIENTCRLCATHGYNYYPIFDTNSNLIVEKIHNCLPIVIDSNDKLPTHICNVCLEALDISDKLRSQCLIAESILKQQLLDPVRIKTEKEPLDINSDDFHISIKQTYTCQESDWKCEFCDDKFKSAVDFVRHINDKHCEEDAEIKKHANGFTNIIDNKVLEYPIEIKGESITDNILMASNDEEVKTHCDICNIKIEDQLLMEFHGKFHQPRVMQCYNCSSTFPSPYELYIHKKTHHVKYFNMEMKWFCDKCEKMIDNCDWAKKHMNHCIKRKPKYHCKYCQQEFVYKKEFTSHQRKEHYNIIIRDPNFKKFQCDLCSKTYIDKRSYHNHVQVHKNNKNGIYISTADRSKYCCKQCGASFQEMRLLRDHYNIHTGERPYGCKTCNKTFRTYFGFYSHRQSHKNSTFFCAYCHQMFLNKRTLTDHIAAHEAPENWHYFCEICKIRFPVRGRLERHIKKYQDTHCLTCDVCGIEFLGMHRLRKHQRIKHAILRTNNHYKVKTEHIT